MLEWKAFQFDEPETYPKIAGYYRVRVEGESEIDVPYVHHEYDDYTTWAEFSIDPDGEGFSFKGVHDEEEDQIIAYYGPIEIPPLPASFFSGTKS